MAAHYEHALLSLVRHCRSANEIWLFHVISKKNMTDLTYCKSIKATYRDATPQSLSTTELLHFSANSKNLD